MTLAAEPNRAVLLRYSTGRSFYRGSGWRLGGGTILTADHCAVGTDHRVIVDGVEVPATVVARSGTTDVDIAVLEAPDLPPLDTASQCARVDPHSDAVLPISVFGFPGFKADKRSVHVAGRLSLGEGRDPHSPADRPYKLTVRVDASPPALPSAHPRLRSEPPTNPWSGISGSAVLFDGYVIGVMDSGYPTEGTGALTFTPLAMIDLLPADRAAALWAALGLTGVHDFPLVPNPFELLDGGRTRAIVSPAGLLRADADVLEFIGRSDELDTLETWCADPEPSVLLLHGPGGQGKTRLARAFADRLRRRGWRCGLTPADPGGLARLLDRIDTMMGLAETATPTLIVVDYAETQRPDIADTDDPLVQLIARATRTTRFLLVARAAGLWFEELTDQVGCARRLLPLRPVSEPPDTRADRYTGAVRAFADHLPGIDGYRGTDWATLAKSIDAPNMLVDSRFDHLLTLYERALVDLLQAGPDPVDAAGVRNALLDHERRYWRRSARAAGLHLSRPTLTEAVAGITLFGAADNRQARATIELLPGLADQPEDTKRRAVDWLRTLYPDPRRPWAPLEPDRLGEHLVAEVWAADDAGRDTLFDLVQPSLTGDPGPGIDEHQLHQMLVVLARTSTSRPDEAARRRIDAIRRAVRAVDSARPDLIHAAPDERREYLRLAALRSGSDLLTGRLTETGPAPWHARWAWWNTRRPSRTILGNGSRGLIPINGNLLAVNEYSAQLVPLGGLSVGGVTRPSFAARTVIGASAYCTVLDRTYVALASAYRSSLSTKRIVTVDLAADEIVGPPIEASFRLSHFGFDMAIGPTPNSLTLLTASRDRRVQIWDLHRGTAIGAIAHGRLSVAVAVGQVAGEAAYVTAGETVEVVSAATLRPLGPSIDLRWHMAKAIALVELPSGAAVVVGCADGVVRVFDLPAGTRRWHLTGHGQAVRTVSIAEFQGRPAACTAGDDRTVIFWDLIDGSRLGEPHIGHRTSITASAFTRLDGHLVALTASRNDSIRAWNVAGSRYPEDPFIGHTDNVVGVEVLPAHPTVVTTVSEDRTVRIWDLETGRPAREPINICRNTDRPTAFAANRHPDGRHVAVGTVDGAVSVVDVVTGRRIDIGALEHQVTALAFGRGPRRIVVAADRSGTVRAWRLDSLDPVGPGATLAGIVTHLRVLDDGRALAVVPESGPSSDQIAQCVVVDLTVGAIDPRWVEHCVPGRIVGLNHTTGHPWVAVETEGTDGTRTVLIHDLDTEHPTGPNWTFRAGWINHVEFIESATRTHVLVVGDAGQLWVRELGTLDRPDQPPFGVVSIGAATVAATITVLDDRPILFVGDRVSVRTADLCTEQSLISAGDAAPAAVATTTCYNRPSVAVAIRDSGQVEMRDLSTGRRAATLFADSAIRALGSSLVRGTPILHGDSYLGPRVWNVQSWQPLPLWTGIDDRWLLAVLSVGERTLLVTARTFGEESPQSAIEVQDLDTADQIAPPIPIRGGYMYRSAAAVVRSHPIAVVNTLSDDGISLHAWDLTTRRELAVIPGNATALTAGDTPDGPRLFVGRVGGTIEEWDMPGPDPARRLRVRPGRPRRIRAIDGSPEAVALLVRPNGELIAGRGDTLVLHPFAAQPRAIRLGAAIVDLAASPDDPDLVIVATEDGVVAIDVR